MHTMPQFLGKILCIVDQLKKEGKNPEMLYLSSEDERTLTVQLWQEQLKVGSLVTRMHAPPNIRVVLQDGELFGGMFVQWNAPFNRTSVCPHRETVPNFVGPTVEDQGAPRRRSQHLLQEHRLSQDGSALSWRQAPRTARCS